MNILLTIVLLVLGTLLFSFLRKEQEHTSHSTSAKPPKKQDSPKPKETQKSEEIQTPSQPKEETPEVASPEDQEKKEEVLQEDIKEEVQEMPREPEKPKKKEPSVYSKIILYGPNNSHKTQLFYSLLLDKDPLSFKTVTSIMPNISETFKFNQKVTTLVDIPGHSNFESRIGKHLEKNALLLFVFKTESEQGNYLGKTAHKLYEILTKHDLLSLNITLGLIVIKSKNFGGNEEESEFIKEFEKEIERIKFSRRTHVNVEEGSGGAGDYLKDIKDNFALDHIRAKSCQCKFLTLEGNSIRNFVNSI